jgi:hypothetical protein
MTTYNLTGGAAATPPYNGKDKYFVTPKVTVTIPTTGITNDVIKAVPLKAGWLVRGTIVKIVTPATGTTVTLDFGITGGTANGFDAAIDGKASAGSVFQSQPYVDVYTRAGGYYVTADTTLDILLNTITAMTAGTVLTIQAEIVVTA